MHRIPMAAFMYGEGVANTGHLRLSLPVNQSLQFNLKIPYQTKQGLYVLELAQKKGNSFPAI